MSTAGLRRPLAKRGSFIARTRASGSPLCPIEDDILTPGRGLVSCCGRRRSGVRRLYGGCPINGDTGRDALRLGGCWDGSGDDGIRRSSPGDAPGIVQPPPQSCEDRRAISVPLTAVIAGLSRSGTGYLNPQVNGHHRVLRYTFQAGVTARYYPAMAAQSRIVP